MKQTIKLSFIYFKEQIVGLFSGVSKRAKNRTIPTIILLFSFLAFAIGYSFYTIAENLNKFGASQNILIIGLFMALFLSLMVNISDTQGSMYKSKDYDLLMSLPLKNITIITAKYLGSYITTAIYFLSIAVPSFVVYFIFNGVNSFAIIFGLLSFIFMPTFSQLISCVIGFIVNAIASRMRNKNVIRTVFTLIFSVSLAVFISVSNSNFMGELFVGGVPLWFKIVFSNIYFLYVAITTSSFVYYVYAFLVCLLFMVLGISIVTLSYRKINTALMVTKIKGKPSPITYGEKSVFKNLLKKEFTTFFSSPVYCVNGLIGLIMSAVSVGITLFTFFEVPFDPIGQDICASVMLSCIAMCLGVAPTTSVSISIEGSKLQNLKALPISFKEIAFSKCVMNLIFSVPTIVICVLVYSIITKLSALLILLILIYLFLTTTSQTTLGLLLNLKFPRLNWTSEMQAVKGGASMFITMFVDMLLGLVPMIIFIVWLSYSSFLTLTIFMPIIIFIQLVYMLTILGILIKKGEKIFKDIQV